MPQRVKVARGSIFDGFPLLDAMMDILGTTKATLWPIFESTGNVIRSFRGAAHYFTMTDGGAQGFYPFRHVGGINSLHFLKTDDMHGAGEDHADFEFGDGTVDVAFSMGAWVWQDVQGAEAAILAKFDVAGTLREWKFAVNASNKPELTLYDESADTTEVGAADTALTLNRWHFVVITYDGDEADPDVNFYLDGAADGEGTTETGAYVAMEATATPLMLGAADDTAAPTIEFNGRIALPFICGKELTAVEVNRLYGLSRTLMGV